MPIEGANHIAETLVIGSDRHQHVVCVDWDRVATFNLVDFETVVVDPRPLTNNFIKSQPELWRSLRAQLSRLLLSGGHIIAICEKRRVAHVRDYNPLDNYAWSPLWLKMTIETGASIRFVSDAFSKYLSHFKRWTCFYSLGGFADELLALAGHSTDLTYEVNPYAINREGRLLAGEYSLLIAARTNDRRELGDFVFLPAIQELDQHEGVSFILEDVLGLPQTTLPPKWVASVPMPRVPAIVEEIDRRRTAIREIGAEIADFEAQKRSLEEYKKLVYASGRELENIFERCLGECGGTIKSAQYSQEEFVLEYNGRVCLIECKGVGKSIGLTDARQLLNHTIDYEKETGEVGRGILLGNAWRGDPIEHRGKPDTPIFPENVIRLAGRNDMALVWSVDFFRVFCRMLLGEITGDAILELITGTAGVVDFTDLLE